MPILGQTVDRAEMQLFPNAGHYKMYGMPHLILC